MSMHLGQSPYHAMRPHVHSPPKRTLLDDSSWVEPLNRRGFGPTADRRDIPATSAAALPHSITSLAAAFPRHLARGACASSAFPVRLIARQIGAFLRHEAECTHGASGTRETKLLPPAVSDHASFPRRNAGQEATSDGGHSPSNKDGRSKPARRGVQGRQFAVFDSAVLRFQDAAMRAARRMFDHGARIQSVRQVGDVHGLLIDGANGGMR